MKWSLTSSISLSALPEPRLLAPYLRIPPFDPPRRSRRSDALIQRNRLFLGPPARCPLESEVPYYVLAGAVTSARHLSRAPRCGYFDRGVPERPLDRWRPSMILDGEAR